MGIGDHKAELLSKLTSMQKQKRTSQQNAAARNRLHDKEIGVRSTSSPQKKEETNKPRVVIFGKQKLFFGTLKSSLSGYFEVIEFTDVEKATEYILDNPVPAVVMDMDPPTDWRECHDLFTTGKTMYPNIAYIVYQAKKTPDSEVMVLQKQGAIIENKPLNRTVLINEIKSVIEKNKND